MTNQSQSHERGGESLKAELLEASTVESILREQGLRALLLAARDMRLAASGNFTGLDLLRRADEVQEIANQLHEALARSAPTENTLTINKPAVS